MSHADLVQRVRRVARAENDASGRRWLSATVSILANWGGASATSILRQALPGECFSGKGSSGRGWEAALAGAAGDPMTALLHEAAERAGQPDPRNVAMTLLPTIGIVKETIAAAKGPAAVDSLIAALPEGLRPHLRAITTTAPWAYQLIPQSYARPERAAH